MNQNKQNVRNFYDELGWKKASSGTFVDAMRFEDLRPVSHDYMRACNLRIRDHIAPAGNFILDAGSGPVQYDDYLDIGRQYRSRVCVDLSKRALEEARQKMGDKGLYVQADITRLPFKDGSFDAALAMHVIYHIPEDEQATSLREIVRALKPGSSGVVVYNWGIHSLLMWLTIPPVQVWRAVLPLYRRLKAAFSRLGAGNAAAAGGQQQLYFHAHSYAWFQNALKGVSFDIQVWRSISVQFQRIWVHERLFGKGLLRFIQKAEERFPRLAGRYGQYPLIILKKPRDTQSGA